MPEAPRPFFLPMIGLVLLFAAFGPLIGGALFIPLAVLTEAPSAAAASAVAHIGGIATMIGHAFALIPAYILGIAPAAATGFVHSLWDAWAPRAFPRALVAAAVGGLFSYELFVWLSWLGGMIEGFVAADISGQAGSWLDGLFSGEFDATLQRALIASGALAGFVCAMTASLIGLTTSAPPSPPPPAETAS